MPILGLLIFHKLRQKEKHKTNKQKTWLTGSITQAVFEIKYNFAASPQQDSDVSWEWNNFYALKWWKLTSYSSRLLYIFWKAASCISAFYPHCMYLQSPQHPDVHSSNLTTRHTFQNTLQKSQASFLYTWKWDKSNQRLLPLDVNRHVIFEDTKPLPENWNYESVWCLEEALPHWLLIRTSKKLGTCQHTLYRWL